MERSIATGESGIDSSRGFTLLELMIVVSIVGILATIAAPTYQKSVVKAREAVLRQDLFTLRDVLDQHRADQGKYPPSLQALVSAGYLRAIPKDPFTQSETTWQEMSDATEGGVIDVFSGSEFVGTNGTPYNRW
jgi:general secretion pathway protein G